MYAEDDGSSEEFTRSAEIRRTGATGGGGGGCSAGAGDGRYGSSPMTKGYVQYSQPSLNGT